MKAGVAASVGLVLAACGSAGSPSAPTASGDRARADRRGTVGLYFVGILTADLPRSLSFYRRLGLDLPEGVRSDYFRFTDADGHVLFWETWDAIRRFDPTWRPAPPGGRRIALEFGFRSAADLDETYSAMLAAGARGHLAPFDQGAGIRYAVLVDPDDNQVGLRYPSHGRTNA